MKKILLVLIFLLSSIASASVFENLEPIDTITEDGVHLKGVHLKNEGGQPIVAVHGFLENTRVWREVAIYLHSKGYDVYLWNMRGHGNGSQRSEALKVSSASYSFDNIVAYDIPSMIDYVFKRNQKKVLLLGHSMGTMAARLTLSGVSNIDGTMKVTPAKKGWATKRVLATFSFGSPTTFNSPNAIIKLMNALPLSFTKHIENILNGVIKTEAPFEKNNSVSRSYKAMRHSLNEFFLQNLFFLQRDTSLLDSRNLNSKSYELSRLFRKGITPPPKELIENAKNWIKYGYKSLDGRLNYEHLPLNPKIPYIFIAGGKDKLADPIHILQDFQSQKLQKSTLYVLNSDYSHIDLIVGEKAGKLSGQLVDEIFQMNFQFLEKNKLPKLKGVSYLHYEKALKPVRDLCKSILRNLI